MKGEIRETPDGVERMVETERSTTYTAEGSHPSVVATVVAVRVENAWREPASHDHRVVVTEEDWERWPLLFEGYLADDLPRVDADRPAWLEQLGPEKEEQLVDILGRYDEERARFWLREIGEAIDGFVDCPECNRGVIDGEKCPVCDGRYRRTIEG